MPLPIATMAMDSTREMKKARVAQEQYFTDLNYPGKKQYRAFPSYTCLVNFAEQRECRNILEIGAGLSTAVWADFAQRTGAKVSTIDANFARIRAYIKNTRHEVTVANHINLIEGTSICADDLLGFYTNEPQTTFGGVDVAALREEIDRFQSNRCSLGRWQRVSSIANKWDWSARELMTTESTLCWPGRLLDLFAGSGSFDKEFAFFKSVEARGQARILDDLLGQGVRWDLVFFDSGELSSNVEWLKLKNIIPVGGFAAFHDIFFPKSLKNIIPCAAVMADPDWKVLFCDNSTKQGLLIAERLR